MKKRTTAVLSTLAAAAIAVAGALPASAAVTYKATAASNIGSFAAVDTSTNTIYSITDTTTNGTETLAVSKVDGKTLKQTGQYVIGTADVADDFYLYSYVGDLRVNSTNHTVWFTINSVYNGAYVQEINGTTLKSVRSFSSDAINSTLGSIALNPTSNTAYVSGGVTAWDDAGRTPFLAALNGSTGAISTVTLPTYTADQFFSPGNVAYDSANKGVYVSFDYHELAYSSATLKLASTVAYPTSETDDDPLITADGSTHTIYAVGTSSLYKITGSTNTIASTASIGTTSVAGPVVDPTIKTVYVGTGVYSETSLAKTGTLPYSAVSVNGSTHSIYSAGYVTTRSGS